MLIVSSSHVTNVSILNSRLCNYSHTYTFGKEIISYGNIEPAVALNNTDKKVIFKRCPPFTKFISEINNKKVAKKIHIVMPMYNLIEYSNNYSKRSGNSWQYYKDGLITNNDGAILKFNGPKDTKSFKFKQKTDRQNR